MKFFFFTLLLTSFSAIGATWNDVSRLNPEDVATVIRVKNVSDVVNTIKQLSPNTKVVISGTRHSQGGHITHPNAVVLDMTGFNKVISISPKDKLVVVQSGATWAHVQKAANQFGLAVKVMQSSNIFSIGGSLSANVHGRDPRFGPVIETVQSIKMVLANGEIVSSSRNINPDLFYAAIGGYGLLGVIIEAEIELTENLPLVKTTKKLEAQRYARNLEKKAESLALHYGRCSFVPDQTFLQDCYSTDFVKSGSNNTTSVFEQEQNVQRNALIFNASRKSDIGKLIRWKLQKEILDKPGKRTSLERNTAMQPPVKFLTYYSPEDTDILQEYFVPIEKFPDFFDKLKSRLQHYDVNLLSITLRYLKKNTESYLSYSTNNMIAIVLYINLQLDEQSIKKARRWTREFVDLSIKNMGTYYLTYQRFPRLDQFMSAYPNWEKFMAVKCQYDPNEVFSNRFYSEYLKAAYSKRIQQNTPKAAVSSATDCLIINRH